MPLVTMPDGTPVQMPDNPDPALIARLKAFQAKQAPQPSFTDKALGALKNIYGGFLEPAATMASAAIAQPVAGIAGLGQMANNALGVGNGADPADTIRAMQSALTYQPRTDAGKATLGLIGQGAAIPGQLLDKAGLTGQNAADMTGSPAYGAATDALAGALPTILGTKLPELGAAKVDAAAQDAVDAAPRQSQIDAARDAGYHLPPSEVSDSPVGKTLTGVAGKDQLNQVLALHNQKVTNGIAKTEAGIASDAPLDATTLQAAADKAGTAYQAVKDADQALVVAKDANGNTIMRNGKPLVRPAGPVKPDATYASDINDIGSGTANKSFGTKIDPQVEALKQQYGSAASFSPTDGISAIKQLRSDSRANFKAVDDPAKLGLAQAQMQAADAIEGQIARYLDANGQTTLYKNFTDARTKLAKINTIQDAMDASGNIDASKINAYRNRGGYVAGGLKTVADAADSFKSVVKNTQGVQRPAPFSAASYLLATAGVPLDLTAGHAAGATAGATAALLAARPGARAFLNSGAYQGSLHGVLPAASPFAQLAAHPASPLAGLGAVPVPDQQQQ